MSNKLRYTRSARGYTVWAADGTTRLGEVRKVNRPGKTDTWSAWYDGELLARPGSEDTQYATRGRAAEALLAEHELRWGALPQIVVLHLADYTDHITGDGTELTKRPYPFHVDAKGNILGSRGDAVCVVGFQNDAARQQVDLYWPDYIRGYPQRAVGKYLITQAADGKLSTQICAVERVEVKS